MGARGAHWGTYGILIMGRAEKFFSPSGGVREATLITLIQLVFDDEIEDDP